MSKKQKNAGIGGSKGKSAPNQFQATTMSRTSNVYKPSWEDKYGVKKVYDLKGNFTGNLSCMFCLEFDPDPKDGVRKPKESLVIFASSGGWRSDHFRSHLSNVHPNKYAEYQN